MKPGRKSGSALRRLTITVLWRRRGISFLLAGAAFLGVFASVFLHGLTERQEAAMEGMMEYTEIRCVVGNARGMDTEHLNMPSPFVDRLTGRRQDENLEDAVKSVRAKAVQSLSQPANTKLRRILSLDSDPALSAVERAAVTLWEGWEESVFATEAPVCLIPEGMTQGEVVSSLIVTLEGGKSRELTVIGTVSGGPSNGIWCPFYMKWRDDKNITEAFPVDSCSFVIADNSRLEECKKAIFEVFLEPGLSAGAGQWNYSVMVQDEIYQNTMEEYRSQLSMLRLLLPVLLLLSGGISFFAAYLTTRSRIREYAVMRCLGRKRRQVFAQVFGEQALLAAVGGIAGGLAGFCFLPPASLAVVWKAGLGLCLFLAGAAAAAWMVSRVDVMKWMKEE